MEQGPEVPTVEVTGTVEERAPESEVVESEALAGTLPVQGHVISISAKTA